MQLSWHQSLALASLHAWPPRPFHPWFAPGTRNKMCSRLAGEQKVKANISRSVKRVCLSLLGWIYSHSLWCFKSFLSFLVSLPLNNIIISMQFNKLMVYIWHIIIWYKLVCPSSQLLIMYLIYTKVSTIYQLTCYISVNEGETLIPFAIQITWHLPGVLNVSPIH